MAVEKITLTLIQFPIYLNLSDGVKTMLSFIFMHTRDPISTRVPYRITQYKQQQTSNKMHQALIVPKV